MGIFKGLKDMKGMLHAAPGLLDQANQLSANAAAMQQAAQQQVVSPMAVPMAEPVSAHLTEAIAGVDLALFASI